jgi:chlorite dismutase
MDARFYTFVGGETGLWQVEEVRSVRGDGLQTPRCLDLQNTHLATLPADAVWALRGAASHQRYTTRAEQTALAAVQAPLGRVESVCAALIPIRKNAAWWLLTQDERRAIFEERSSHTTIGLRYLPTIARKLYHSRDLGEPFDFLTWFEFAPEHRAAFDDLLGALRASEEWNYVEREVDVRLVQKEIMEPA